VKLYAEVAWMRTRQILGDLATVFWIAVWVLIGTRITTLVDRLQGPGRTLEESGSGFARNLSSIAERVPNVPVIGDDLRAPFDAAAQAGTSLASAGQTHQEVVHTLALWLGVLIAVIPIGYVLLKYVPSRMRWIREATAAARFRIEAEDLQLFAIRAVATKPLYELRKVCDDPGRALAEKDYEPLASLELQSLGLR
jgi:hypothetical protein